MWCPDLRAALSDRGMSAGLNDTFDLVPPSDCPRDLWRVLSSTVKAPVFREEGSRAANAGKISSPHLVRITQRLILFCGFPQFRRSDRPRPRRPRGQMRGRNWG